MPVINPSLYQSGTVTPGHLASFTTDGVVQDSGISITGGGVPQIAPGNFAVLGTLFTTGGIDLSATSNATPYIHGAQTASEVVVATFAPINILQISDNIDYTGPSAPNGFWVQHNIVSGAHSVRGGRVALQADMTLQTVPADSSAVPQYAGLQANFVGQSSGSNCIGYGASITSAAFNGTGYSQIVGMEVNVGAFAGTTVHAIVGVDIVPFGSHAVAGSSGADTGLGFGTELVTGGIWDYLIRFGGTNGSNNPLKSTGTVLAGLVGGTIARGIDFRLLDLTSDAFASPGIRLVGASHTITNVIAIAGGSSNSGVYAPGIFTQGPTPDIDLNISLQGAGGLHLLTNGGNEPLFTFFGSTTADGYLSFIPGVAASFPMQILCQGTANNLILGGNAANTGGMARGSTGGFPMLPFMAGTPTATPANSAAGGAVVVNQSTNTLNVFVPGAGWCHIGLSAGAG
jgi:hypothetical protein